MKPAILYARNIFGNVVFNGFAPEGDDWESYGFSVDANGNPILDQNRNTIADFEAIPFDPENQTHIESAFEYTISDGCRDRVTLEDYLIGELDIPPELLKTLLNEWCNQES